MISRTTTMYLNTMVESLTNLDKVGKRAFVTIEPLKIHGIEACPVRIMAFLDGALIPE